MNSEFYAALPVFDDFLDVSRFDRYAPLPDDWHLVMSDVCNSTVQVERGSYKQVNTAGAATITAVLNAAGTTEIPFVFEGDGAILCVPPQLLDAAKSALLLTRDMTLASFGLELRAATMPVAQVRAAGYDILVARHRVSRHYIQATFTGGGMEYACRCMKDPATAAGCAVLQETAQPSGSFEGLECRWEDIPSRHGETVSLVVKALSSDPVHAASVYQQVIAKVRNIYGDDATSHPVSVNRLSITLNARQLAHETGVRNPDGGWTHLLKLRAVILLGWFLMKFGIRTRHTAWGEYKETLVRNTDAKKFNDVYRQILSGRAEQRAELVDWLQEPLARRELAYGLHVSDCAHMTCLVFDYSGRHLHFIDGADGGMFSAAKALKNRLQAMR